MPTIKNPLDLYRLLPRSNCRECRLPSCLAFAAAVIKGEKRPADCPGLDLGLTKQLEVKVEKPGVSAEQQLAACLARFGGEIGTVDFSLAAPRLGATLKAGGMTIKCLGKPYFIHYDGRITSECHINPWVIMPLVNYVLESPGRDPLGEWVPFRELEGGDTWNPLFEQRCEKSLHELAAMDPELLEYLLLVFGGRPSGIAACDLSVVLHPLPKVPVLISYSRLENGAVRLNVFFDLTAADNLGIKGVFGIFAGIVAMVEKIMARHSLADGTG